jgi:hypothetical protein
MIGPFPLVAELTCVSSKWLCHAGSILGLYYVCCCSVTADDAGLPDAGQITAFRRDLDHLCRAAFYCIGVFPVLFAYIFA